MIPVENGGSLSGFSVSAQFALFCISGDLGIKYPSAITATSSYHQQICLMPTGVI